MRNGEWNRTHGHHLTGVQTPTYTSWCNMKSRCDNENNAQYRDWGGRGIYYGPKWIRFENFLADMGEKPEGMTLDRIDNDGPYYKENCRWATRTEQRYNRRDVVRYEFNGESLTVGQWSRRTGVKRTTIEERLKRGLSIESALKPVGNRSQSWL